VSGVCHMSTLGLIMQQPTDVFYNTDFVYTFERKIVLIVVCTVHRCDAPDTARKHQTHVSVTL
jgi:hypothetical protein